MSVTRERRLLDIPLQPSPTDPDGEHKDRGQRQRWSEADAEQKLGDRCYADAIVEARTHFSAGDHGFSSFRRELGVATPSPRLLLPPSRLRSQAIRRPLASERSVLPPRCPNVQKGLRH